MGIFGLTGFIDRNTHLLRCHELKNCPVVIDGSNLYHHIYRACHIQSTFGGDYDVYRQQILVNFKSLLKCGVTPYVVLDGGYTTDNRKLKKCIERAKQRIRHVRLAALKGRCQLTPLLAYDTFLQTLNELKISHVTCQFEADSEIAKLANKLQCPVISNDSDFYIFDLTHGFLPLDYIDFNPLYKKKCDGSKPYFFLHCQLYQVEDFINSFEGLSRSILPVFATLLGNDFVPPKSVESVFARIQVPKAVSKRFHLPKKLSKVIKLLHWLEMRCDDSNNVLDKILPYIHSQKQFLSSVKGYFDVDNFEGCDLFKYFSVAEEKFEPLAASTFVGFNGAAFPSWFVLSICKGEITPAIMNAAVLHRVIFLSQVENLKSPTAHICSEFVRKVIYGILMASDSVVEKDTPKESITKCHGNSDYLSEVLEAMVKRTEGDDGIGKISKSCGNDSNVKIHKTEGTSLSCEAQIGNDSSYPSDSELPNNCEKATDEVTALSDNENEMEEESSDSSEEDTIVREESVDSLFTIKQTHFEEYHRDIKRVKKSYLEPVLTAGSETLPSLSELDYLTEEKLLFLMLSSLRIDSSFVSTFSRDLSLYMACIVLWIQHADPQITEHHLDCAILCPILLHMLKAAGAGGKKHQKNMIFPNPNDVARKENDDSDNQQERTKHSCIDLNQVCEQAINSDKFQKALSNLDRYRTSKPDFSRKTNCFDAEITHAYAQLQSCMFEVSNLNKLLRFPLPNIKPATLINGSFLYNFYSDLVSRPMPDNFIEAMILKGSDMHDLFLNIKSVLLGIVGNSCFIQLGDNIRKRRKKNKGRRKRKLSSCEKVEAKEDQSSHCEESEEETMTIEGFEVKNKFSLLSLK